MDQAGAWSRRKAVVPLNSVAVFIHTVGGPRKIVGFGEGRVLALWISS
jgi:hypothetical protein